MPPVPIRGMTHSAFPQARHAARLASQMILPRPLLPPILLAARTLQVLLPVVHSAYLHLAVRMSISRKEVTATFTPQAHFWHLLHLATTPGIRKVALHVIH